MSLSGKLLVNGHQVVCLPPGFRKFLLEELVKGFQIIYPPILSGTDFAEIAAQLHKSSVPLQLYGSFPGQNLIDPTQNEQSPAAIQLRCHERSTAIPQIGQANQGRSLLGGE